MNTATNVFRPQVAGTGSHDVASNRRSASRQSDGSGNNQQNWLDWLSFANDASFAAGAPRILGSAATRLPPRGVSS